METEPLTSRLVGVINRQIQENNLSVFSIAEETGIPHVTLRRRLTSHGRGLTVDELERVARHLNATPSILMAQAEVTVD